jgi:hypothetical protein
MCSFCDFTEGTTFVAPEVQDDGFLSQSGAAAVGAVVYEVSGGLDTMGDFMTVDNTAFLPDGPSAVIGAIALTGSLNEGDYTGAALNSLDLIGMATSAIGTWKAEQYGRAGKVFKAGAWRWAKNMAGKAGQFAPAPKAAAHAMWQRVGNFGKSVSRLAARVSMPLATADVFNNYSESLKELDSIARRNRFAIYTGGTLQNHPGATQGTFGLISRLSGQPHMWMPPETLMFGPDAYKAMNSTYYSDPNYWFCGCGGTPPAEYGMDSLVLEKSWDDF